MIGMTDALCDDIRRQLNSLCDPDYRDFQSRLIPTVAPSVFIGVRTPALRALAKRLMRQTDVTPFLRDLPHRTFDENQLHAFLLCEIRDFDRCIEEVERFLPYVDNWATCDQMSPRVFRQNRPQLLAHIRAWLSSDHFYTVRFAIGMLMQHFLDDDFDPAYLEMVAGVRSDEYYVRMMIAWYFATALAKQYDAALPYIEQRRLALWTHNKTIQKATESYRITPEQKTHLKTCKLKT